MKTWQSLLDFCKRKRPSEPENMARVREAFALIESDLTVKSQEELFSVTNISANLK